MRKFFFSIIFCMFAMIAPAGADTYILALPSGLDDKVAGSNLNAIADTLLRIPADSGHTFVFIDANKGTEIGQVRADDFKRGRGDRRFLFPVIQSALESVRLHLTAEPAGNTDAERNFRRGLTNIVKVLTAVPNTYGVASTNLKVIVAGTRYYIDDADPTYSTLNASYPSDGNLAQKATKNPFGTADKIGRLRNTDVIFTDLKLDWGFGRQKESLDRFWHLYIDRLGGRLVTIVPDLRNALSIMTSGAQYTYMPIPTYDPDDDREGKSDSLDIVRDGWVLMDRNNLSVTREYVGSWLVQPVAIAIRWNGIGVDYDLHVRPDGKRPWLNYKNREAIYGRHFKDRTPSNGDQYEIVELNGEVDLRNLRILVNLYRGRPENGTIEVRVRIGSNIFVGESPIAASSGDRGLNLATADRHPAWVQVNTMRLLRAATQ